MASQQRNTKKAPDNDLLKENHDISEIKAQLSQQNSILKRHSEFLMGLSENISKKIDAAIAIQVNEKLELLNKKISDVIKKLNEHLDKKIELARHESKNGLAKLRSEIDVLIESFNNNKNEKPSKRSFDLFSEDALNMDFENHSSNDDFRNLEQYKNAIKKEIINDIYFNEIKRRKDDELNSILAKEMFRQNNNNVNKLDFEFNRKLSRNKKTIIKQKIIDTIGNKKLTLPELKEDIVDFNNYCSKATFYRYFNELKSKNLLNYRQQGDAKYITSANVLEQYEKKNK